MKNTTKKTSIRLAIFFYVIAVSGVLVIADSCNKSKKAADTVSQASTAATNAAAEPLQQNMPQTNLVSVVDISTSADGTGRVIFRELEEAFNVTDAAVLSALKTAQSENKPITITFDPWKAVVTKVNASSEQERASYCARQIVKSPGSSHQVDLSTADPNGLNDPEALGVLNTTSLSTGLTDVIPDMATAQLMFDYITHQCCAVPGPYGVDYCITFQYCEDGCYARAHKMCYILNTRFHYATHKVFSFAYPSAYTLSVKAEKWGGCCINWWYHVAPLVNIKTPSGTKAYVIDPAMFDQPVLLATWLHAQQNPACASGNAKVTSFNIQPTTSYSPNDTATFDTDPMYTNTDHTLTVYHSLITCP